MSGGFEALLNALEVGEHNAIHQAELAERLRLSRDRLKKEIQAARRSGVPILSSTSGYWIAENDGERERFKRMMKKQAFGRLQSIEAIEGGDNGQQANAFEDGHTE